MKSQQLAKIFATKKFFAIALGAVALFAAVFFALRAHADTAVTVMGAAQGPSNTVVTSAPIGTLIHATVLVSSSTGPMATGTVDFNSYQNLTCSGATTTEVAISLVGAAATSSNTALPNTGLSYMFHYNGNGDYPVMNSNCVSVTATASSTTLSTTLSTTTSVLTGSIVHDSATLGAATSNASGSVAYKVYTNNTCTTGVTNAGTGVVTNGTVGDSNGVQFYTAGTYYWQAVYSGDASNAIATSTCGSEVLTVVATTTPVVNTPPIITLVGANPFNLFVGNAFVDPGATATDTPDGNITANIVVTGGPVNTAVVGTTTLVYTITDAGSLSASTTRTVVVHATTTTPGSGIISGTVYNDANKNFAKDGGEAGIAGFTINLYLGAGWWGPQHNNPVAMSAVTDANGHYSFGSLADGVYSVEEINQAGWKQQTGDFKSITISNGSSKTDADFGNTSKTATTTTGTVLISGTVYNDANKNLTKDSGEMGLSGWTINLYKGKGWKGAPIQTVTTDANGHYSFGSLAAGIYSVEQITKMGWTQETGDFKSIMLIDGGSKTDADFADATSTIKRGNGHWWDFFTHFRNNGNKGHNGNNGDDE